MGWGFYMIHGCLQVFASELSVEARATALSLHSFFFFMGQTHRPDRLRSESASSMRARSRPC
jgi:DHA1 family inner membrane transport protein